MNPPLEPPAWHQAVAYTVTGHRYPELGRQDRPDLELLADFLRPRLVPGATPTGSHPLPADLAAGVGAAQLAAAVAELRRRLAEAPVRTSPVTRDRRLSADELRLLRDVPPHHGS